MLLIHSGLTGIAAAAATTLRATIECAHVTEHCYVFYIIFLQAQVESVVAMCSADNVHELLADNPDFVLDAIDNIHTKVQTPGNIACLLP